MAPFCCGSQLSCETGNSVWSWMSYNQGGRPWSLVPQGTVLRPLWFLLYINDLPDCVTSQVRLFADDCLVYRLIVSIEDQILLQKDLDALDKWSITGEWSSTHSNVISFPYQGASPNNSNFIPCMGLSWNMSKKPSISRLSWVTTFNGQRHINSIVAKSGSTLGLLRRNFFDCP